LAQSLPPQVEEAGYAEAEAAEAGRRAAVLLSRPVALDAEAALDRAADLAQEAADVEFHAQVSSAGMRSRVHFFFSNALPPTHLVPRRAAIAKSTESMRHQIRSICPPHSAQRATAQVLENRSKGLLRESAEMSALAAAKAAEADAARVKLTAALAEAEAIAARASDGAAGDLPQHITRCQREIGALAHRMAQLREEISWAEREVVARRAEGDEWGRLLTQRQSDLGEPTRDWRCKKAAQANPQLRRACAAAAHSGVAPCRCWGGLALWCPCACRSACIPQPWLTRACACARLCSAGAPAGGAAPRGVGRCERPRRRRRPRGAPAR
jgi:hypothetical protein